MAILGKKKKKEADAPAEGAEKPAEGEAAEGEAPAGSKKKKMIIIIAGAVVLLGALGAGGYFMFAKHGGGEAAAEHAETGAKEGQPVFFDLPQMLVNLNTGTKQVSFIKTTVTLELVSAADVPAVQANLPLLIDSYNTFLREMRATDLYGSAGIYRLREEMLSRANKLLAPVKVKDVLFKELIVQ
ncbi:MAG: flagellar basal body-associated FliL family protein [Alphaproteobacteria bacterium]|nr:flagellar basal body-associated FliL family protein [Alphaproteobacteria bacterium]